MTRLLTGLRQQFSPVDLVSVTFLAFLTVLNVLFASRIPQWPMLLLVNLAGLAVIVFLGRLAETKKTTFFVGLHRWYCYPFVILVFKEIHLMVHPIHPEDFDWLLIAADRWLFGVNPTQWIAQFAHPVLTEILQIAYFSYYVLFIILGVAFYRRYPIEEFDKAAMIIVYGFYLSYLGYFLLPSVGPRFMLHDFSKLSVELPGLLFTEPIRAFINAGESIPTNLPNPVDFVQRDVFPSGHVEMTLIVVILSFRYRIPARRLITVIAGLLVVATVYLRYHYVVDLAGGVIVAGIAVWTGDRIERWWNAPRIPHRPAEPHDPAH